SRGQDDLQACGFDSVRLAGGRKRQKQMILFHPYRHKTVKVVVTLFSSSVEESHGIALIGGETTRREHYGGGSSNQMASDVAEEEVVDPGKVKMAMNVSNEMPCNMLPVKK
ncbi:hypothetical protein Tco_0082247, partial [Tanacetum coccineum]